LASVFYGYVITKKTFEFILFARTAYAAKLNSAPANTSERRLATAFSASAYNLLVLSIIVLDSYKEISTSHLIHYQNPPHQILSPPYFGLIL